MILQTDLLGKLSAMGMAISLISPDDRDPELANYCRQYQIDLYSFHSNKWIWKTNYGLYRSYFLEDIGSNPALYEKHYYEIHLAKHKWKILKFIPHILILFQSLFKAIPVLRKAFKQLENIQLRSDQALQLLSKINPQLIVSTYPVNPQEGILLHNARRIGIKTAIQLLSWDNITSKGHFYCLADYYLAWGPIMKSEFIEKYGITPEKIMLTGVAHFDLHKESKSSEYSKALLAELELDTHKPYLVFGMSSPRFVPKEIEVVEFLAQKINSNDLGKEMQMIIRPHPQNIRGWMADSSWLVRLKSLENTRIKLFEPMLVHSKMMWSMQREDMIKLSALLKSCIVCINSCSTLSIDALMAGKGNIAPLFDGNSSLPYWASARRLQDYIHIKKFIAAGGSRIAGNYEELLTEIKFFLQNPDYKLEDRKNSLALECNNTVESSTELVIQTLKRILHDV